MTFKYDTLEKEYSSANIKLKEKENQIDQLQKNYQE